MFKHENEYTKYDIETGYYDLLVAIVVQAINDYLALNKKTPHYVLPEHELEAFLNNFFSDTNKVDAIMKRAKMLLDSGETHLKGGL